MLRPIKQSFRMLAPAKSSTYRKELGRQIIKDGSLIDSTLVKPGHNYYFDVVWNDGNREVFSLVEYVDVEVANENYEKELEHYNKQLAAYEASVKDWEKKNAEYEAYLKEQEEIKARQSYEELKKRFGN